MRGSSDDIQRCRVARAGKPLHRYMGLFPGRAIAPAIVAKALQPGADVHKARIGSSIGGKGCIGHSTALALVSPRHSCDGQQGCGADKSDQRLNQGCKHQGDAAAFVSSKPHHQAACLNLHCCARRVLLQNASTRIAQKAPQEPLRRGVVVCALNQHLPCEFRCFERCTCLDPACSDRHSISTQTGSRP